MQDLEDKIKYLESWKARLTFFNLAPGRALEDHVKDFTYLPKYNSNVAFFDVINFIEGCKSGNGLCKNLTRYSLVSFGRRKDYINLLKAGEGPPCCFPHH